jgi:prepilin-type N-terminal cleavage/methylation domain-containing protein
MKYLQKGFTIVEITIVLAVVGILAAFIYISLTNIATGARDTARENDTKAWMAAFDTYKARFLVYPLLPTSSLIPKTVCLGTFTNNKCGQYGSSVITKYIDASGTDYASLRTEIARAGSGDAYSIYANTGNSSNYPLAGPILYLTRNTDVGTMTVSAQFINFFEQACPSGYTNINGSLPLSIALVLSGLPSGTNANACSVTKTFTYTPS